MLTLLFVLILFLLAFAGLSIGIILRNRSLRAGCGGAGKGDCKEGGCSCRDGQEKSR